ncbi:hypothetical protein GCM10022286_05190 [Gryllotalpicola daejeonensis]|uniref:Uncharacterized protein n=1 Tax=Gryllotalpicola daejeonensis TaxID=993087 RepID=A0ABP7ZF57_9MICO
MRKGDNGDGVSHTGDAATSDDALAAALESHFAPFAAGRHSVPIPVPHDDPRADAEVDHEDEDPEVTAITRKFDRTGDTLGAMDELEQLLIQRTGQIPVVTPDLLAAHAARLERARPAVEVKADVEAEAGPDASPEAAAREHAEPGPVVEAEAAEPAGAPAPEGAGEASGIDWSIPPVVPLDPAPGFSPWIDPEATAAAIDTTPAPEYTDVSTKVFAVFSADRAAPEPERQPEPVPEPDREAEAAPVQPAPDVAPAAEPESPTAAAQPIDDELDGIDDLADTPRAPLAEPEPRPEATPVPVPVPVHASTPEPEPEVPPAPEEPPRKRRFWPFGRR